MLRILALLAVLIPHALRAETVPVLSGEHADFSRLVFQFDGETNWQVGRWERGYELRIDRSDVAFDTSTVFNLIPKQRILALEETKSGLRVVVGDEVHADAFEIRKNRIVLDIKNGEAPEGSRFEASLAPPVAEDLTPEPVVEPEDPASKTVAPQIQLPLFQARAVEQVTPQLPLQIEEAQVESERARAFEQKLIEQLSRAASQGLLEADLPTSDDLPDLPTQTEPQVAEEIPDVESPPAHEKTHVKVRTRMDIDAKTPPNPKPITTIGETCLPDALFALGDWGGTDTGFDLPALRSSLLGEFDEVEPGSVRDLARHYLFLSFGEEAKAVMNELGVIVPDADLLTAIADVMDNNPVAPNRMTGQQSCAGDVAMWAVLVSEDDTDLNDINEEAVKAAFSALPVRLRKHLGPKLSAKLVAAGEVELALANRSAISRIPGETDPTFDLLDARIELALGNEDGAWETLEEVSDEGRSLSAEATLELLQSKIEAEAFIESSRIKDAESYAFERRGSEMGEALAAAAIHATISNGAPEIALQKLDPALSAMPVSAADSARLTDLAYDGLAALSEDIVFLQHAVGPQMLEKLSTTNKETRTKVASRLMDLGFAQEARSVLDLSDDVPSEPERRVLARAALASGNVQIAVGYLSGLSGEEAERLRANAMAAIKNHSDAARIYAELGLDTDAAREAWLAQEWPMVSELGSGAQLEIASILSEEPVSSDMTPLESNRALIARSARVRDLFDTLTR